MRVPGYSRRCRPSRRVVRWLTVGIDAVWNRILPAVVCLDMIMGLTIAEGSNELSRDDNLV